MPSRKTSSSLKPYTKNRKVIGTSHSKAVQPLRMQIYISMKNINQWPIGT